MPHRAIHPDLRRQQLLRAVVLRDDHGHVRDHATELLEEVDVEVRAAELAVGHRPQPDVLLHRHDLSDRAILDLAQLFGGDRAGAELRAGGKQVVGARGSCRRGRRGTAVSREQS